MIGLVMAGGAGARMRAGGVRGEKLLLAPPGGQPSVLAVAGALRDSGCVGEVLAATSPLSPGAARALEAAGVGLVRTAGSGYSADMAEAVRRLAPRGGEALVVPGDMPLLDAGAVRRAVREHRRAAAPEPVTAFVVPERLARAAGRPPRFAAFCGGMRCAYTGVSAVRPGRMPSGPGPAPERLVVLDDPRIAFSLNTARDYEELASGAAAARAG